MKNKTKALLMRLPLEIIAILLVIIVFYLKISNNPALKMGWETPITILVIVGLYFLGRYIENKEDSFF